MPKSKSTRAGKSPSNRDRFIRLVAFCCYRWKADPYTDDIDDAYKPAVTDFTKDLKGEYRPALEFTDIKLDTHIGGGITNHGHEYQPSGGLDYPDYLNPFADDEAGDIGDGVDEIGYGVDMNVVNEDVNTQAEKKKRNSIDDYPEVLNPFAEDE